MNKSNIITCCSVFVIIIGIVAYVSIHEEEIYGPTENTYTLQTCKSIHAQLEKEESSFKKYTHSDLPRAWILAECWK